MFFFVSCLGCRHLKKHKDIAVRVAFKFWFLLKISEHTGRCSTLCSNEVDDCGGAGHWQDLSFRAAETRRNWLLQKEAS